jgi:hypothetical protein
LIREQRWLVVFQPVIFYAVFFNIEPGLFHNKPAERLPFRLKVGNRLLINDQRREFAAVDAVLLAG